MLFMKLRPFLFQKQFVLFTKSYNSTPSVLVTANHHTDNGNSAPVHNGITTWIEVIFIFFLHFQNIQFLFTSGEVNETCLSTNVLHLLIYNEWNVYFQNMNSTGFRACLKELYETRYEPVSLGYAVLTGQLDSNYFLNNEVLEMVHGPYLKFAIRSGKISSVSPNTYSSSADVYRQSWNYWHDVEELHFVLDQLLSKLFTELNFVLLV